MVLICQESIVSLRNLTDRRRRRSWHRRGGCYRRRPGGVAAIGHVELLAASRQDVVGIEDPEDVHRGQRCESRIAVGTREPLEPDARLADPAWSSSSRPISMVLLVPSVIGADAVVATVVDHALALCDAGGVVRVERPVRCGRNRSGPAVAPGSGRAGGIRGVLQIQGVAAAATPTQLPRVLFGVLVLKAVETKPSLGHHMADRPTRQRCCSPGPGGNNE